MSKKTELETLTYHKVIAVYRCLSGFISPLTQPQDPLFVSHSFKIRAVWHKSPSTKGKTEAAKTLEPGPNMIPPTNHWTQHDPTHDGPVCSQRQRWASSAWGPPHLGVRPGRRPSWSNYCKRSEECRTRQRGTRCRDAWTLSTQRNKLHRYMRHINYRQLENDCVQPTLYVGGLC